MVFSQYPLRFPRRLAGVLLALALPAGAAPPAGYYDSAEGKTGAALESALHGIIDNHTSFSYSQARDILKTLDLAPGSTTEVALTYSSLTRRASDFGGGSDRNGSTGDWNREHVWPRSYGIDSFGDDNSDLFNLRPCDVDTNAERDSLYFDAVPGGMTYPGADGVRYDNTRWEPRDDEKGDLARGCFYMAVRYDGSDRDTVDLELGDTPNRGAAVFGTLERLLEWHRSDPVDAIERTRNDTIYTEYQQNRNPFIDRPEFAELLYLPRYPGRDADADGLPDLWEWQMLTTDSAAGTDDTDLDGAVELLEFAFGMDPMKSDLALFPYLTEDGTTLVYREAEAVDSTALEVVPEGSDSLLPDSWSPLPERGSSSTDGVVRTWEVPLGPPEGQRFFRVRVHVRVSG